MCSGHLWQTNVFFIPTLAAINIELKRCQSFVEGLGLYPSRVQVGMSEFCDSALAEFCAELPNSAEIVKKMCGFCSAVLLLVRH